MEVTVLDELVQALGLRPGRRGVLGLQVADVRVTLDVTGVRVVMAGCEIPFDASTDGARAVPLGFEPHESLPWWVIGDGLEALEHPVAARLAASGAGIRAHGVEWTVTPEPSSIRDAVDLLLLIRGPRPASRAWKASLEALEGGATFWLYPLVATRPLDDAVHLMRLLPWCVEDWPQVGEEVVRALSTPDHDAARAVFASDDTRLKDATLAAAAHWPAADQRALCAHVEVYRHDPRWWAVAMGQDASGMPSSFDCQTLVDTLHDDATEESPAVLALAVRSMMDRGAERSARSLVQTMLGSCSDAEAGRAIARVIEHSRGVDEMVLLMEVAATGRTWDCLQPVVVELLAQAVPTRHWWEAFVKVAESAGVPPASLAVEFTRQFRVRVGADARAGGWIRLAAQTGEPTLQEPLLAWLSDTSHPRVLVACLDALAIVGGRRAGPVVGAYDSFFNETTVREAARRAASAIEGRVRSGVGRISMVEGQGAISTAKED